MREIVGKVSSTEAGGTSCSGESEEASSNRSERTVPGLDFEPAIPSVDFDATIPLLDPKEDLSL